MSQSIKTPIAQSGEIALDNETALGSLLALGWLMQSLGEIGSQLEDARRMIGNSASPQ